MNRRDLLKYLITTPIALTLDLEKLLWVPNKVFFLPTRRQVEFLIVRNQVIFISNPFGPIEKWITEYYTNPFTSSSALQKEKSLKPSYGKFELPPQERTIDPKVINEGHPDKYPLSPDKA